MNTSTKKLYTYISLTLVMAYFIFVLLMFNSNELKELYNLQTSGFYYMFVYVLLVAVGYVIDTQTRKEPAFITLFTVPAFSLLLLLGMFIMGNVFWVFYIILCVVILALYILGIFCYKKWINKIMLIKRGYENILLAYVIIHVFVVLFVAFKTIGML